MSYVVVQDLWSLLARSFASILIPHRGLLLPANFEGADDETVLIPPPDEGQCIEVDVLYEPGLAPQGAWPGQTSELQTKLVGRLSLYQEKPDDGLAHITLVSTYRPESESAKQFSEATITAPAGVPMPTNPRVVYFERMTVDGQQLPVLTEMPVGHMTPPTSD